MDDKELTELIVDADHWLPPHGRWSRPVPRGPAVLASLATAQAARGQARDRAVGDLRRVIDAAREITVEGARQCHLLGIGTADLDAINVLLRTNP
jgi:hypothetical protein